METMLVKRDRHPDEVVRINAEDFDPATETLWQEPETPAKPAKPDETPAKPAKPVKK